jgi:hypothetical protein
MMGFATAEGQRMPIIDLRLAFGHLIVVVNVYGPLTLPEEATVFIEDIDGIVVVSGRWNLPAPREVSARQYESVILPVDLS